MESAAAQIQQSKKAKYVSAPGSSSLKKKTAKPEKVEKIETSSQSKTMYKNPFEKIHGETYLHNSIIKDVTAISSESVDGKYSKITIDITGHRAVQVVIETTELNKVSKRIRDLHRRYTAALAEDDEPSEPAVENPKKRKRTLKPKALSDEVDDAAVEMVANLEQQDNGESSGSDSDSDCCT